MMPKTEDELRHWVVEHNHHTTHDRTITSNYGYNRILGIDLVSICAQLRDQFEPPIKILDIGCGDGTALNQLSGLIERKYFNSSDFEFWGMGVNRYKQMAIPDSRLIIDGLMAHKFSGEKFHLVFSVFAFHYIWHKLEAIEKIHNQLLFDGGKAVLHFPGYLVRYGESPQALNQTETDGNRQFKEYLGETSKNTLDIPLEYKMVPSYSDDDDCVLLAEFGNLRFQKLPNAEISFRKPLQAFTMFDSGFTFRHMNDSDRVYVASHYEFQNESADEVPEEEGISFHASNSVAESLEDLTASVATTDDTLFNSKPYRIVSLPFETEGKSFDLDIAIHACPSEEVLLICPGAYEPLLGRVIEYEKLATAYVESKLGAALRYNDPYDGQCDYQEFLMAKTRRMIEYAIESADHFCSTSNPRLKIMAYSSSAGAVAALASEYENIDALLLIAPSFDLQPEEVMPKYRSFRGDVKVLIGDSDNVVLPQQAFKYYENVRNASTREYVEVPSCGHRFEGAKNKDIFFQSAFWAFGKSRPSGFPLSCDSPSESWL